MYGSCMLECACVTNCMIIKQQFDKQLKGVYFYIITKSYTPTHIECAHIYASQHTHFGL